MRAHRYLIPLAVVAIACAQVAWPGSFRPIANRPGVSHVDALPPKLEAKMRRFLDYNAMILPAAVPGLAKPRPSPARLGFGYREIGVLKLPLFAYRDLGFVLYDSDGVRIRAVPLDDEYVKVLEAEAGQLLGRGYVFPLWWHVWGWLVLGALAVALRSWLREQDDRRIAAGII